MNEFKITFLVEIDKSKLKALLAALLLFMNEHSSIGLYMVEEIKGDQS